MSQNVDIDGRLILIKIWYLSAVRLLVLPSYGNKFKLERLLAIACAISLGVAPVVNIVIFWSGQGTL
ncbi:hypothetical protein [Nostoc sp.]|uniref:hypothetical protein n=1 Tax=Nostoc sp. TaxID=1180 RepID=UPI003FA5BD4C